MTAGDDQLSGWTEKKLQNSSQNQTCNTKKVMVTVWWSAAHLNYYSFLNPSETITSEKYAQQIDEMH